MKVFLSPVEKYHGLARPHLTAPRFLMRPLLNGGTLGGLRMGTQFVAVWLVDGFLHPPGTVAREFVDVDDFLRIPLVGLTEIVQFAVIAVDFWSVLVFGESGSHLGPLLTNALADRYPSARRVFLTSVRPGMIQVQGTSLAELDACGAAITQFRLAWDESPEVLVQDDVRRFVVNVAYKDDQYALSVRPA